MELTFKTEANAEQACVEIKQLDNITECFPYFRIGENYVAVQFTQGDYDQTGRRILDAVKGLGGDVLAFTEGEGD